MSSNKTPRNSESFRNLVEADKRSILEKLLETALPKSKSKNPGSADSDEKNGNTTGTQASDYDQVFGEDIDDSEELFKDILKRARAEFEKQKEFERKYPEYQALQDIFKKPAPKKSKRPPRKTTKVVEKTLAIMNNFKKRLMEPEEPVHSLPTISSSNDDYIKQYKTVSTFNNDYKRFKSSIQTLQQGNQDLQKTIYPTWKTTETYTPIFSATTNPNWANPHSNPARTNAAKNVCTPVEDKVKKVCTPVQDKVKKVYTPVQDKFYTPGHIDRWMDAANTSHFSEPPSCKSIRSDVAVHDSDSDDDSIKSLESNSFDFSPIRTKSITNESSNIDYKTSFKNTTSSSTSQKYKSILTKSANVDCKTPPKYTTSSSTPKRSTTVRFRPSPPECFVYGSDGNSSISSDFIYAENENISPIRSPKNCNKSYQDYGGNSSSLQSSPLSLQNEYCPAKETIEYEEHHAFFSSGNYHGKNNNKLPDDFMKKPMFLENFARNLASNVKSNLNMEVKCSMRVKYYKS